VQEPCRNLARGGLESWSIQLRLRALQMRVTLRPKLPPASNYPLWPLRIEEHHEALANLGG